MSTRTKKDIKTTLDRVSILSLAGWVSGTAGANPQDAGGPSNMTGSLIGPDCTDASAYVTYPSGTVPGYSQTAPTGSILVTLPQNNTYTRTLSWDVTMEASGTDHKANSLSSIWQYEIVKYGHSTVSGTFLFGWQRLSGSAVQGVDAMGSSGSYVGAIPEDRVNPSSPACRWELTAIVRDATGRPGNY